LPALSRGARVIEKVTKVGFQWDDLNGPLAKLDEEVIELKDEVRKLEDLMKSGKAGAPEAETVRAKVSHELGDALFCLCNLGYLLRVNPEDALRGTLDRFQGRFRHIERRLKEQGKDWEETDLAE